MSETSENTAPAAQTTAAAETTAAVTEAAKPERVQVRKAFGALKRHPLGMVALVGAAVALVEVELAVGILAGIGATALLTLKTGPEARQEVLAKGKWALERARSLKVRTADAATEAATPAAPATAPEGAAPEAAPSAETKPSV
jgi:hypothetical protein